MESSVQPLEAAPDPIEEAMARALVEPSVAGAIAAFDLRRYRAALSALLASAADEPTRAALRRLQCTLRPFARPVKKILPLWLVTWAGCGFRLIGEHDRLAGTQATIRWFTLFFLPIWPLRGYIVRETAGYKYEFLAEVPFDPRLRAATIVVPAAVALVWLVLRTKGAI